MGINIKDFSSKLEAAMSKALEEATSKKVLTEAKNQLVADIKKRVTLGFGVEKTGAGKVKFKPLAPSYIDARSKYLKLGKNATKKKSNLHQTGQMIEEDLDGIVNGKKIIIGMQTDRSAKVAAFVEKTRPFLNLSGPEVKRIIKFFQTQITDIFKKSLKNLN